MSETEISYVWQCDLCGECICNATCRDNPATYKTSKGMLTYPCDKGYKPVWTPIDVVEIDLNLIKEFM